MSSKHVLRVVCAIAGLAAVAVGVSQIRSGISEMLGGESAEVNQRIDEGNQAVDDANQAVLAAAPKWHALANDIDKIGVAIFRTDRRGEVDEVIELYAHSAAKLSEASRHFARAAEISKDEVLREYLSLKSRAFDEFAATKQGMAEAAKLVLDRSIADAGMLAAQLEPAMAEVEAHDKAGNKLAAAAEALSDKHPETFDR